MELTPWKLPSETYTMEVTSWNLHHGSYQVKLAPWKLPRGTSTMELTSWNLHHGSYQVEHTSWKYIHRVSSRW